MTFKVKTRSFLPLLPLAYLVQLHFTVHFLVFGCLLEPEITPRELPSQFDHLCKVAMHLKPSLWIVCLTKPFIPIIIKVLSDMSNAEVSALKVKEKDVFTNSNNGGVLYLWASVYKYYQVPKTAPLFKSKGIYIWMNLNAVKESEQDKVGFCFFNIFPPMSDTQSCTYSRLACVMCVPALCATSQTSLAFST